MNKKILMFGILGILSVIIVTAGIVNYLSNTQRVEIKVESPLTLVTSSDLGSVYGGSTATINAEVTNHINETVNGILETIVSNDILPNGDATCEDFESITIEVIGGSDAGVYDLSSLGTCSNSDTRAFIEIPVVYLPNEIQSYIVSLKFNLAVAPANYDIDNQIMVAP